jgi:hypothetical protein
MKNAISLIQKDLRRHKITMLMPGRTQGKGKSFYLILVMAKTSMLQDLKNAYGGEVKPVHLKIAKKIFGEVETENVYGVLVDENLKMVFAFNREFADYDSKKKAIVFKDLVEVLIGRLDLKKNGVKKEAKKGVKKEAKKGGGKTTKTEVVIIPEPIFPSRGRFPSCGLHALIKYSLVEKKKP